MARPSAVARLAIIGEDQWGLVTRRQAQEVGIARATLDRLVTNSLLERVDRGVYRLAGAPVPDHMELRAAWLGLDPGVLRWQRPREDGVVSHRSAAAIYEVGDLPADRHEFTFTTRRQSRRPDLRFHLGAPDLAPWVEVRGGLPVTRPSRIASDLLLDYEVPESVAHIIIDSIRAGYEQPVGFAGALAPHAAKFRWLKPGDGLGLLGWLLALTGDREADAWMEQARAQVARPRVPAIVTQVKAPA